MNFIVRNTIWFVVIILIAVAVLGLNHFGFLPMVIAPKYLAALKVALVASIIFTIIGMAGGR